MNTSSFLFDLNLDISNVDTSTNRLLDFTNFNTIAVIINNSIVNNKALLIDLDNYSNNIEHYKSAIYIVYKSKITCIDWSTFYFYNNHFYQMINNKDIRFSIENTWYNIFFIRAYYSNSNSSIDTSKISLVSNSENAAIFSIYDSYVSKIAPMGKNIFSYYFSYPIGKFILYNCHKDIIDNKYYLTGSLLSNLSYSSDTNSIEVLDICGNSIDSFSCPKTFINFKNDTYGIFLKDQTPIIYRDIPKNSIQYQYNNSIKHFSRVCGISNTLYFRTNREIYSYDIDNIFKYIVKTIPKLNRYSKSFKIHGKEPNTLAITLDISLYYLLPNIISIIDYIPLKDNNHSYNSDIPIVYETNQNISNNTIHIVSELYILFAIGFLYIPKMLYLSSNYTVSKLPNSHMHLVFSREEMNILYRQQKDHGYESLGDYLKIVIAKCLSIFIENHLLVYIEDQAIDYFPIYNNMENSYLNTLIYKNKKSRIIKGLLTSFIEKLISNRQEYILPLIIVNLFKIPITENINLTKINIDNYNGNSQFPITISIYYNSDYMVFSINYNKDMEKIKYIFNEFLEQLLK